ncbi:EAL domain-containing protein [Clostridium sp. YIM B02515]|uniref:EAL domain-containing protein n=1 Tax=Clostridium rhizosphaerae TaxID=2803861 RepID=A0ABS1T858_9CLOT|nr:EAL domain-containing protein [Clostridium rhizosphaerae]MBL4935538.1 EAL domain-containing protein [Clostridium rhizosphaerae]
MKKIKLFICIFFLVIFAAFKSSSVDAAEVKNILVIHSYNEGFAWTNSVSKGINSVFDTGYINVNIKYDYMDLKENSSADYLDNFYNLQKMKYSNIKFDAIIASDNGAMDYLIKYGDKLFPNTPVVFCGINEINPSILLDKPQYKIVKENLEVEEMIKNILSILPNTTTFNVYGSNTNSGKNDFNHIKAISSKFTNEYKFNFYENTPIEKVKDDIRSSNKNTAFIFVTDPFLDESGHYRYINNLKDDIFKNSPVPLFSFWDFDLGYGTIGGKITSGFYQGEEAAKIALKIISGSPLQSILQVSESPNKYMFDYAQLKNFKINPKVLPKGSIIINENYSFFQRYKWLVIGAVVVFLFLITIISLLSVIINQKRKNEIELNNSYEELSAVHEELTATEEELRAQYEELQENEEIIRNSEERYRLAIEGANDAIWEWNLVNNSFFISEKWTEITGHDIFSNFKDIYSKYIYPADKASVEKDLNEALNNNKIYKSEFRITAKDGSIKWLANRGKLLTNSNGRALKIAGSITDITERKLSEKQIKQIAYFDVVTNLPNRYYFMQKFKEILSSKCLCNKNSALMFLDLDEFKRINDTLGHDKGDYLLKEIAIRLNDSIPLNSIAGRFGGDEFLVLIPEFDDIKELEVICNNLLNMFKEPFIIDGALNYVTTSIGISIAPIDGEKPEVLLKNADTAMYRAKEQGKNQYCFFSYSMGKELVKKITIENNLRDALENKEFELYYQPQVNLFNGKVEGMEALIRWNNKELGFVPPNNFIPIAEKTGLIVPIGNWVLETACKQNRLWLDKGLSYNSIAVNVSCIQFIRHDFIDKVNDILTSENLQSIFLEIEITESLLMDSTEDNINKLKDLKAMGVKISLDDFGTGYSSLNYLRQLPINVLKIDKSFVQEICDNTEQRLIVDVIINLSHKLGYKVVAEGVETKVQLELLKDMGCDIGQGYYFSRPVNAETMEALLMRNEKLT